MAWVSEAWVNVRRGALLTTANGLVLSIVGGVPDDECLTGVRPR